MSDLDPAALHPSRFTALAIVTALLDGDGDAAARFMIEATRGRTASLAAIEQLAWACANTIEALSRAETSTAAETWQRQALTVTAAMYAADEDEQP
jgi:hypothetical protein